MLAPTWGLSCEAHLKAIARHARLVARSRARFDAHGASSVVRQLALLCRRLLDQAASMEAPLGVRAELSVLATELTQRTREPSTELAEAVWTEIHALWAADAVFNEAIPA